MSQQLVLAIEPDLRQAAIVKRIVREKALADVAVVDSRDAAIEAMRTCMPDVLLLSALLSPRDEDELIAHLKTLEHAGHLQTHTIPQLASALHPAEERGGRGLLSAFRRKKDPGPAAGCDPDLFADEIRVFLKRAAEKKRELLDSDRAAPDMRPSPAGAVRVAVPDEETPQASSWSSPFEWKPGGSSWRTAPTQEASNPSSLIADPGSLIANPESPIAHPEPAAPMANAPAPLAEPVSAATTAPEEGRTRHQATPNARDAGLRMRAGFRIKDSGFRVRDSGSGIKDQGLAWLRREASASDTAAGPDDMRALLSTLAVPSAVASVTYPRGCRVRRVRVPAVPDADSAPAGGALLAARGAAGDRRDRHQSV